jgi:hypothetical protein
VELAATALQERLVGGFLDHRVPEEVVRRGREPASVEQLRVAQLLERSLERYGSDRMHRSQQAPGELPTTDRAYLRHLLGLGPQSIEARHQRILERLGYLAHRRRGSGFGHRLGELLDEERDAVGARGHLLDQLGTERRPNRHLDHHLANVTESQSVQAQQRMVRAWGPARPELRTSGGQEEKRRRRALLRQQTLQRQGGGVDPLQVLEQDDQRLLARIPEDPCSEGREQAPVRHLGRFHHGRVLRRHCQLEQRCDQWQRLRGGHPGGREPALQPGQRRLRRAIRRPRKDLLQQLRHRIEGRVRVVVRSARLEPDMRHPADLVAELTRQSRLPDARLARHEHQLTLALTRLLEAGAQQTALLLSPDERRQPAERGRGEPALHAARTRHPPELHCLADSLESLPPAVLEHEDSGEEPARRLGDENAVGLGHRLDPRRHVGRLAQREGLRPRTTTDLGDDDGARVDPDPRLERRRSRAHVRGQRDASRGVDDRNAGAHRPLGRVLVGLRPAEVGEEPVPQVLRHVAAEACHRGARLPVVGLHQVAPLLGIHLAGQLGRAHQVGEEDGQVSALGSLARGSSRFAAPLSVPPVRTRRCIPMPVECGATARAEARPRSDLVTAARTGSSQAGAAILAEARTGSVVVGAGPAA